MYIKKNIKSTSRGIYRDDGVRIINNPSAIRFGHRTATEARIHHLGRTKYRDNGWVISVAGNIILSSGGTPFTTADKARKSHWFLKEVLEDPMLVNTRLVVEPPQYEPTDTELPSSSNKKEVK